MYLYNEYQNRYGSMRPAFSYMRLLNASPGSPAVDVYANAGLVAPGLAYRGFTEYLQVVPGSYNITVFAAGTTGPVLLNSVVEIPAQSIVTAAIIGIAPQMGVKAFFEPVLQIPAGSLYLRFANLVPDGPEMDLLADGRKLFEDISYGAATNYIAISPNVYTFNVQQSGTGKRLLYVPNIQLLPGRFYTVYTVGEMNGAVPLQVLIPLDGNSYIQL